jgi:hypothetical protein
MRYKMFTIILLAMSASITTTAQKRGKKIGPVYVSGNTESTETVLSFIETKDKTVHHYHMQLTNSKTATTTKSREIIVAQKPIDREQILGKLGNIIWVLNDSLTGYNMHTLEPAVTESGIAAVHPFLINNFSRYSNSYQVDEAAQVMYLSTMSGNRYKLYPDLSIRPDSGAADPAPDDYSYEFYADYKINGKYDLKYALSCIDTLNSKLFILGSKLETSQVLSYFGVSVYPDRDEMRLLNIIPFNINGDKVDFAKNIPITATQQYLGAAFLLNKFNTTAWQGKNGEHIILYRSGPGSKATLCFAMIDRNGNEQWKGNTSTAYLHFNDYLVTDNSLVLWVDEKKNGLEKQHVFYIQLKDGKTQDL